MDRHISLRRASSLLLLAAVVLATTASAGNGRWMVMGPIWGGTLGHITINPSNHRILYATGGPGVLESTNRGSSWAPILALSYASALAADVPASNTLYAGSYGNGIWKSVNGGMSWQNSSTGLPAGTDFGTTWDYISELAADPSHPGVIYAATYTNGMYKTSDGGAHWVAINTGLSGIISSSGTINTIVVDPVDPQTIYIGDTYQSGPTFTGAVYRSSDGGGSWNETGLTAAPVQQLVIDPNDHAILYAAAGTQGLYASSDSGADWSSISTPLSAVEGVQVDPSNSQHLWAGSFDQGLYTSTDEGADWSQDSQLAGGRISDITPDPANPSLVYALPYPGPGLLKSNDGGSSWVSVTNSIPASGIAQLLVDKSGVIYAGTSSSAVLRSTDRGLEWSGPFGASNYPWFISSLVQDPEAGETLYAAAANGVFKSTDGGVDWTLLNNGLSDPTIVQYMSVAVDPHDSNVVYAGTSGGSSLYKSTDGGASWQASASGIDSTDQIDTIAVDPADSNTLYAGAKFGGFYKSTNAGASWDQVPLARCCVFDIVFDPKNPQTIYLAGSFSYKSTDGGNTWTSVQNGLPLDFSFSSIVIDSKNSQTLYAEGGFLVIDGANTGAYISNDAGAHWQAMNQFQPVVKPRLPGMSTSATPLGIVALSVDPATDQVYGVGNNSVLYTFLKPGGH